MAIQFVSVRCPDCGAELSIENGREQAFCSYCGAKVLVHNDNEHIYRNIDEARIKEAENERILRLRELELEEKENSRSRKSLFIAYGVALGFVLIGALICIAEPLAGMWGIIIGGYIGLFTFIKSDEKKKKQKKYVSPNEAVITDSMIGCEEKNYNSVVMLFRGAGFTNVTAVPLNDLNILSQRKNGQVEAVTINGNGDFDEGDVYPREANILIEISGPKLGRPSKESRKSTKEEYQDNTDRIEVERFFSRDKHSFGAGLIMTKLDNTTLTSIALSVLAANVFKADVGNFFVLYFKDTEEDVTRHYYMEFEPAA